MNPEKQASEEAMMAAEWALKVLNPRRTPDHTNALARIIDNHTHLPELLAVAEAARDACNSHREHTEPCNCNECCLFDSLRALDERKNEK